MPGSAVAGSGARACLLACLLALPAAARGAEAPSGTVAVLGLLDAEAPERTARMAAAVEAGLTDMGGPPVLGAEEAARRLGRSPAPGGRPADLARLEGLFQQGYLQSYSFEYGAAVLSLQAVLLGLDGVPQGPESWELQVRAYLFLGIAKAGLQDEAGALQAFAAVLRTRPEMELPRTEYAPRSIALWEEARRGLAGLPRGRLAVDSEPAGAEVRLDGVRVGVTPYIGEWPRGSYLLSIASPEAGSVARRVLIAEKPQQIRVQLAFEAALELGYAQPCLRLPAGGDGLPALWWPWLGARLGVRHAVAVRARTVEGRPRWVASLVDLTRGRVLREGWLEPQEPAADARALAEFAATGRRAEGLVLAPLAAPVPEPRWRPGEEVPPLPAERVRRPWHRTWWPYALAALTLSGGGAGAHLASDHYSRQAAQAVTQKERDAREGLADSWLWAAVAGYCLGGAALVTGLALHLSWSPAPPGAPLAAEAPLVLPWATAGGLGLGVVGSF